MARLLVLDFDGTMTDAEAEGAPFTEGYLEDLATLTDREVPEIRELAAKFEAEVAANPNAHGWVYEGRIVAPAAVDPYLRIMPVARGIFDHFGYYPRDHERSNILDILYKYNYAKTKPAFKAGAREVLESLERLTGVRPVVVTNSPTEVVERKIRRLGANPDGTCSLEWLAAHVRGHAMKYVVDDTFERVPESLAVPGLDRPVLLRRRHYFEVLDALRREVGAEWDGVTVVGDIFELDLSLPLSLGARVGLVVNAFTPAYERAWVQASPRGRLVHALSEIPSLVG